MDRTSLSDRSGGSYHARKTTAGNIKSHNELDKISKFWDKCKAERGKTLDRELCQLSRRLGELEAERAISRQEFIELEKLLDELDKAENESVPGGWVVGNLVERHFYITECRQKVDRLLRHSRLHRRSEPKSLSHPPGQASHHGGMSSQHGGMSSHHGGMSSQHGGMSSQHGGMSSQHGGMSSHHGGMSSQHGGMSSQHGGMSSQHGGMSSQHGGMSSQHGGMSCSARPPQPPAYSDHDVAQGIINLNKRCQHPMKYNRANMETGKVADKDKDESQPGASILKHPELDASKGTESPATESSATESPATESPATESPARDTGLAMPSTSSKHVEFKGSQPSSAKSRGLTSGSAFSFGEHWQPLRKAGVASSPAFKPKEESENITRDSLASSSDYVRGKQASTHRKESPPVQAPVIDYETLKNCYNYMATSPSALGLNKDLGKGTGHFTSERNEKRRMLAIESVLDKIYEYRISKTMMKPEDALNCRYLRLTPQNVSELEDQCRLRGIDPGLHAFSTEDDVLNHFK